VEFFSSEHIARLASLAKGAARPVILGHVHPDGDALGATSALALFLQQCGKDVTCIYPDTPASHLQFILPPSVPVLCHDQSPQAATDRIGTADLIFLLDCNAFSRTEGLAPALEASTAPKVLIDHHLNPDTQSFNLVFSTPEISSASELLYWILKAWATASLPVATSVHPSYGASALYLAPEDGCTDRRKGASALYLAPEDGCTDRRKGASAAQIAIGTALMTGMTTDTNNFANSVFPSTLRMASELLEAGVDRDAIIEKVYHSYRENRVRLMGYMEYEGLHILPGGGAYMFLDGETLSRFDLKEGESEGLVNVPLSIAAVRLSVLIKEDGGNFRVSVRSKKGTSAQQLAQQYFHGGGHENAAGGKILLGQDVASAQEIPAYVEQILNTFLP